MGDLKKTLRSLRVLLPAGVGIAVLCAVSESPVAQMSEIDSYGRAVTSQTKEDALAFLEAFRSSHLVGDLIESLRPEVAREVCADLPSGVSRARRACEQVRDAPMAEAGVSSGDDVSGTTHSSTTAAPTQPIETRPIAEVSHAAPTIWSETAAPTTVPQRVTPPADGQSEIGASPTTVESIAAGATTAAASASTTKATPAPGTSIPPVTAGANGATGSATVAAESAPSSSDLPEPAAATPPPIGSKPMVYVRSDSGANIFTQATDSSAIIGTASSNALLTVFYRDRDWLKVLVPGTVDQAGWVRTSGLQSDAGGIRVVAATETATPSAAAGASGGTGPATVAAESAPSSSDLSEPAAATPPPIGSKPMVYVRSDSNADIFAQAMDSSANIGTASSDAPLAVFYRYRDWLKVLVPGTGDQVGWVHTSRLQSDAGGIRVVPTTETAPLLATAGASITTASRAPGGARIAAVGPVVRIWLSSLKSREVAERTWRELQAAYGDLLANLEPPVRQVDLGPGNGGIWCRLYVGPLASRTEAQTLCAKVKLRAPNSNCLVIIK